MVSTGQQIGGGGTICRIQTPAPCAIRFQRLDHQLMDYVLSREVWSCLLLCLGLEVLIPYSTRCLIGGLDLGSWFRSSLVVILVSWHLWKECNDRTFSRCYSTLIKKVELILEEAEERILASFRQLQLLTVLQ